MGVPCAMVWALSDDNLRRGPTEVAALLELVATFLDEAARGRPFLAAWRPPRRLQRARARRGRQPAQRRRARLGCEGHWLCCLADTCFPKSIAGHLQRM